MFNIYKEGMGGVGVREAGPGGGGDSLPLRNS